jgi:spectrin alpha
LDRWTEVKQYTPLPVIQANQFVESGHFDADNIRKKQEDVCRRYEALLSPMSDRKNRLEEALKLQQFLRDVEDEEDWIREKGKQEVGI